jgi:hypothetical protein
MELIAHEAWKHSEEIHNYFEATFDMSVEPPKHMGFVCKCCWEQFDCQMSAISLAGHALVHSEKHDAPYSRVRPTPITGEQVRAFHSMLIERFDVVIPEVGTWKFECKICKKRLPHRTSVGGLIGHSFGCRTELELKSERVN